MCKDSKRSVPSASPKSCTHTYTPCRTRKKTPVESVLCAAIIYSARARDAARLLTRLETEVAGAFAIGWRREEEKKRGDAFSRPLSSLFFRSDWIRRAEKKKLPLTHFPTTIKRRRKNTATKEKKAHKTFFLLALAAFRNRQREGEERRRGNDSSHHSDAYASSRRGVLLFNRVAYEEQTR